MVESQPSKLVVGVRFSSPAPNAFVAQMVEQRTFNPFVGSSILPESTMRQPPQTRFFPIPLSLAAGHRHKTSRPLLGPSKPKGGPIKDEAIRGRNV